MRKATNERSLVPQHSQRAANLFDGSQSVWPRRQSVLLCRIDSDCSLRDYNSEIIDRLLFELALRRFEKERLSFQRL
jgi:hypothetical protein